MSFAEPGANASSLASPFEVPGHAFYIDDPRRFSVLCMTINATTDVTSRRQQPAATKREAPRPAALEHQRARTQSSSFKPISPSSSAWVPAKSQKTRPISLDIGSKAREALSEISKYSNRRSVAHERSNVADTLAQIAHSLSPSLNSPDDQAIDNATNVSARAIKTTILKPQSFTFGMDKRLTSPVIPLTIQSSIDSMDLTPEFIADPDEPYVLDSDANLQNVGTFQRLLLNITPPDQLARQRWQTQCAALSRSGKHIQEVEITRHVELKFCLRLGSNTAVPSVNPSHGQQRVLFLYADKPDKLVEAIKSPSSTLANVASASLEGVTMIEVFSSLQVQQEARDCEFDWMWQPHGQAAQQKASRCCCAFAEMDFAKSKVHVLAAFSFWIDLASDQQTEPASAGLTNLNDPGDVDKTCEAHTAPSRNSVQDNRLLSNQKSDLQVGLERPLPLVSPMTLDWTELSQEDLESDSPVFRAALANLERRTHAIKKASKIALRSVVDAKARILHLTEAEEAVDEALESLALIAPDTLGKLRQEILRPASDKKARYRRQDASMLEESLEKPLSHIIESSRSMLEHICRFDAESKAYYNQTQKWLGSHATTSEAHLNQRRSNSTFSDAVHKQDRADEKQKLRELHFERSRLDLFAALYQLHGGAVEAQLARCIFRLSQWHLQAPHQIWSTDWPSPAQQDTLSTFDDHLNLAVEQHQTQCLRLQNRRQKLSDRLHSLEQSLDGEEDSKFLQGYVDMGIVDSKPSETSSSASPSKGNRLKNFFDVITNSRQSLIAAQRQSSEDGTMMVSLRESQGFQVRRRLSLKTKQEQTRSGQIQTHSFSVPNEPQRSDRQDAAAWANGAARMPLQSESDLSAWSVKTCSTATQDTDGPLTTRQTEFTEESSKATSDVAASSDRKKEGVLWVLSKSVTGPAGTDAPRAVNRSAHWRECWVVLSGSGQISEFADWKGPRKSEPTNAMIDLRFATVREARGVDRRFVFEIVTRDNRRFFQASDEINMKDWIRAVVKAIESLLNGTSSVRKLDRAVRASPFPSPASPNPGIDEGQEILETNELDRSRLRHLIGSHRKFSQSMTDLPTLTKAQASTSADQITMFSPSKATMHIRGISNKTPTSGYLGKDGLRLPAYHGRRGSALSDTGSVVSLSNQAEADSEFDRKIESCIQRSYGSQTSAHREDGSPILGHNQVKGTMNTAGRELASVAASTKASRAAEIAAICIRPDNATCADCRGAHPRWASWMLANEPCCIFICIDCSGVHRSLGVHISKVRSVDLDDWTDDQLDAARTWGNAKANEIWEWSKPAGLLPAAGDQKTFWQTKYVEKRWKKPHGSSSSTSLELKNKLEHKHKDGNKAAGNAPDKQAEPREAQESATSKRRDASGSVPDGPQASSRPTGPRPLRTQRSPSMGSAHPTSPPVSAQILESEASAALQSSPSCPSAFTLSQKDWAQDEQKPEMSISGAGHSQGKMSRPLAGPVADVSQQLPQETFKNASDSQTLEDAAASSFFVSNLAGRAPSPLFVIPGAGQDQD